MKKLFALAVVMGVLFVGAAGCSSDSSDDKSPETTAAPDSGSKDDSGSSDSGSGSDEVAAYCKAVDEYVQQVKDAMKNPTSADTSALTSQGQELTKKAQDLAGNINADEAKEVADCSKKAASALTGG